MSTTVSIIFIVAYAGVLAGAIAITRWLGDKHYAKKRAARKDNSS
jgi:hypothetical protein